MASDLESISFVGFLMGGGSPPLENLFKAIPIKSASHHDRVKRLHQSTPETPPLLSRVKRTTSAAHRPLPENVRVVRFKPSEVPPQGWEEFFPRLHLQTPPRKKAPMRSTLSALLTQKSGNAAEESPLPAHLPTDYLTLHVAVPDEVALPLSLVVPRGATVAQVISSTLYKVQPRDARLSAVEPEAFELRMADDDGPDLDLPALEQCQPIARFGCTAFHLSRKKRSDTSPVTSVATPPVTPSGRIREATAGARCTSGDAAADNSSASPPCAAEDEPAPPSPSTFHFDEFSAGVYKEFEVVKINRHGTRQPRMMGIDHDSIYNMARTRPLFPSLDTDGGSSGSGSGSLVCSMKSKISTLTSTLLRGHSGSGSVPAVKKKSRRIKDIQSIDLLERGSHSFRLAYRIDDKGKKGGSEKGRGEKDGGSRGPSLVYTFIAKKAEEAAEIVARVRFLMTLH